MKYAALLVSLLSISTVTANTRGSYGQPVYNQCTVALPTGSIAGLCKERGGKYIVVLNCEGQLQAFVEPGALPIVYGATCGPNYIGFPNN